MKKAFLLLLVALSLLGIIASSNVETYAATTTIVDEVNLTPLFVDDPLSNYTATKDSSSGWDYTIGSDPFGYRIRTKKIKSNVDKITHVEIPTFLLTQDMVPLGFYNSQYVDPYIYSIDMKLYHSVISSIPYQTVNLKVTSGGNWVDFAYLNTPVSLSRDAYIQFEFRINMDFANMLLNQTVPVGINWASTPNQKAAMDTLFYEIRGSFKPEILLQKMNQFGYGLTYFDTRLDTEVAYNYYKSSIKGERTTVVDIPAETTTYDQLPNTDKSFFENAKVSEMGVVDFEVDNLNLDVLIQVDGEAYRLVYSMQAGTDMSMFTDEIESFYFTDDDQKFLLINIGDETMYNSTGEIRSTFQPYVLWHLNSDEIHVVNRFRSYMFTVRELNNAVYAYFYTDEFIIERLLSISLRFEYRYHYWNPFNPSGPWIQQDVVLEDTNNQYINTFGWQESWLLVGGALTLNPLILMPVFQYGTYVSLLRTNGYSTGDLFITSVQEIQKITPTGQFKTTLEQAYSKAYGGVNPVTITSGMSVYKLFLGQYNDPWASGFEINNEFSAIDQQKGINIIEMTYITQGQLYTIAGEQIQVDTTLGFGTNDEPFWPQFPTINFNLEYSIGLIVFGVVMVIGALNHKGGITRIKLGEFLRLMFYGVMFGFIAYFIAAQVFSNIVTVNSIRLILRI